jgi:hypothetical protein
MSSPAEVLSALLTRAVEVADHNLETHPRMLRVDRLPQIPDAELATYLRSVTGEIGISASQLLAALKEAERRGWTMDAEGRVLQ